MEQMMDVDSLKSKLQELNEKKHKINDEIRDLNGHPAAGPRRDLRNGSGGGGEAAGGLFRRLGPPLNRDRDSSQGPRGGLSREGSGSGWPGSRLGGREDERGPRGRAAWGDRRGAGDRRRRGDDGDDEGGRGDEPKRRRLASAVSIPGKDDDDRFDPAGSSHAKGDEKGKEEDDDDRWAADDEDGRAPSTNGGARGLSRNDSAYGDRPRPPRVEDELKVEHRETVPEIYKKEDVVKRNSRFFGMLNVHLGKAKNRLQKDSNLFEKQAKVEVAARDRDMQESKKRRQQAREEYFTKKHEALEARDELTLEARKTETQLYTAQWAATLQRRKHFIPTSTKPSLFYLPSNHTEKTKQLLTEHQERIDKEIAERLEADEEEFKRLEQELQSRMASRASRRTQNEEGGGDDDASKQSQGRTADETEEGAAGDRKEEGAAEEEMVQEEEEEVVAGGAKPDEEQADKEEETADE